MPTETPHSPPPLLDRYLRAGIEALLLAMALAAPWALGGTTPEAVVGLGLGLGLVLTLWAARIVVTRTIVFRADPPLAALAGLTLLAAGQLLPVPAGTLRLLSPATLETNARLRPDVRERLPGEAGPD